MKAEKVVIGSRGSELALWQSNWVKDKLEKVHTGISVEVNVIKTKGDKILDVSLSKIGEKGLFTKELENELLNGTIDIAVHSLKDLPTVLPNGLILGAVSERIEQRDALISKDYNSLEEIPLGRKIATGSLRRKAQLLNFRPDFNIVDLRGNITTRLKKFEESDWAGVVLAYAGLNRLGMQEYVKQIIPTEIILPAVSQGVLGIEIRKDDGDTFQIVRLINDKKSEIEIRAERSLLKILQGGCQIPIGVYSFINNNVLEMEAMVGSIDGKVVIREKKSGTIDMPERLGEELARILLSNGATEILDIIRNKEGIQN